MACASIIIVEDDQAIREALAEILRLEGYNVRTFENGKEALENLKACGTPCLILLDLMMPVMNSWEFLKARLSLGDTVMATPVLIMSAVADRAREINGVTGYMKKPIDLNMLLRIVQNHCGPPAAQPPDKGNESEPTLKPRGAA